MMHSAFTQKILVWYQANGRKNLPWQKNRTAYRVWISEIMLQQTQVQTVIAYYLRFLERFPTVGDLAHATLDDVLHLWAGLGYYTRARNLHKAAGIIRDTYHGQLPKTLEEMVALPGIGRSTASAILAFSHKQALPILDGNVKRILTRLHAIAHWPGKSTIEKQLWTLATHYTPESKHIVDYTQAIMDLGATICVRSSPKCHICPVSQECIAFAKNEMGLYPVKSPKKILPTKKIFFIVLRNKNNEILLERRPELGIWGGLWSFPESSSRQLPATLLNYWPNIDMKNSTALPSINHTFSHFKLIATPIQYTVTKMMAQAMSSDTILWHNPQQPVPKGVPAPIKKILSHLYENDHE